MIGFFFPLSHPLIPSRWALAALLLANAAPQTDDRTEIAAVAFAWAIRGMPAAARSDLTVEVQVGGVYDRARSEAVARRFDVRHAPHSEVVRCEPEAGVGPRQVCRMAGTTGFLSIKVTGAELGRETSVTITRMRPGPVDSPCRGVETGGEVLEIARTAAGWLPARATTQFAC